MGRHNKRPTTDGDIIDETHISEGKLAEKAVERIGLNKQVCMSCNARNAPKANKCRKCGHKNLRQKKSDYADS